jgi:hypothetical protein
VSGLRLRRRSTALAFPQLVVELLPQRIGMNPPLEADRQLGWRPSKPQPVLHLP